jgi:large subunit ribosomal protein L21
VILTGGKQYRVKKGDILSVEKLPAEKGQKIGFDQVLLIEDGKKIHVGTPVLEGAVVRAEVLANFKDEKVIVFKKKRRKQYRRTRGHRQQLTKVQVSEIVMGKVSRPSEVKKKEASIEAKAPEKKPVKKAKAPTAKEAKKAVVKKPAPKKAAVKKPASKKTAEAAKSGKKKPAPKRPAVKKPAAKPAAKKKAVKKE